MGYGHGAYAPLGNGQMLKSELLHAFSSFYIFFRRFP